MKIFLPILLHLTFLTLPSFAQPTPIVKIKGRVIDASTEAPLHFANVFLSNTSKGAATDEDGLYSIVNVPMGTYELVVSMMGYQLETIKTGYS